MKKFYAFCITLTVAANLTAQHNVQTSPVRRTFTRDEISRMESRRQELHQSISAALRNELLNENFDQVPGSTPVAIPDGWNTNDVLKTNDTPGSGDDFYGPAFRVFDSESANANGYWPVPITSVNNRFAAANDDAPPCDCEMTDTYLETPELDFTGYTDLVISFDIFHDMNFDGGDASLQVSTDGGNLFDIIPIGLDEFGFPVEAFPTDQDYWQTMIVPLTDLAGENSVIFRFQWSDAGSWASGFAIDNIVVGELPNFDLKVEKVKFGNWNQEVFDSGRWDYSQIPITQVSAIGATAVVLNSGKQDQSCTVEFDLRKNGESVSGSPFANDQGSVSTVSLDRDTLSTGTDYVPDGLGLYEVTGTVVGGSGDDAPSNNSASARMEVTQFTYARDAGAAQAFVNPETYYEFGNLFAIHQEQAFAGIDVAIGNESEEGGVIVGRIYEWLGLDESGGPLLESTDIETIEYEVYEEDFNEVGGSSTVFLPFLDGDDIAPAVLEAGKTYLITVANAGDVRIPVSGSNEWVVSWMYSDGWAATLSIPMIRLNSNISLSMPETAQNAELYVGPGYPNPASDRAYVSCSLTGSERLTVLIHDMAGRLVSQQDEGFKSPGNHVIEMDLSRLNAGVYSYTVVAGEFRTTRQLVVR